MRAPLQAKASETTPPARPGRTRGFVVPESAQEASTSSLDAAIERAARFGHDFSRLPPPQSGSTLPGASSNGPVQAKTEVGGVIQRNGDDDKKKPWIKDKLGFGTGMLGLLGTGLGLATRRPALARTGLGLSISSGLASLYQSMGPEGRSNASESIQSLTRPLPHMSRGEYDMPEGLRHPSMYEFNTNIRDPYPNLSSLDRREEND